MAEVAEKTLNLYQKISAVMRDVEYLAKDDQISFNRTNYKAISEEKVTRVVRNALVQHGLVILPVEQLHKREGQMTTIDVKYKIIDIDTGESEFIMSSGTGVDSQDKGVGKAMTYAYKYLLLRTFSIPTGEDPDKISSQELDEKQKQVNEERQGLEGNINQMLMALSQRGYKPEYIQQVCSQAIRPFNQLGELEYNELTQLANLLQAQLQPAG